MIFKLLPFVVLLGIGVRFLAGFAALNAHRKLLMAQQDGRVDQYHADKEAFWRKVDRICIVVAAAAAVWYVVGVLLWLFAWHA